MQMPNHIPARLPSPPMQLPNPIGLLLTRVMDDIKRGSTKIPQFQREFVWSKEKSAKLVDSLLKGFPIGTFILWKTHEELRSIRNIGGIALPPTPRGDSIQYVLDGQQRLTSLFAALNGLSVERSGQTEDFGEMYINLDAEPDQTIVLADKSIAPEAVLVSIADLRTKDFDQLGIGEEYRSKVRHYRDVIPSYQCSVIEVSDATIDTATEIFTRINVTGRALSAFEIMVAKTFDHARGFDLSETTRKLRSDLRDIDYGTISEMVILQAVSAIMEGEVSQKVILQLDKQRFIDTWEDASRAIGLAVDHFRGALSIPVSQLLPYKGLLVPFAYFFYRHPTPPSGEMQRMLHDLFWRVSLGSRYSFALESRLAQDIRAIDLVLEGKLPEYSYPVAPTKEFIMSNGAFKAGRSFIKAILCLLAAQKPKSFKNNTEVFVSNDWLSRANSKNYHHFFPRASFRGMGMDEWKINHIANITIVDDYLNKREIRAQKPSVYIRNFQKQNAEIDRALRSHLIPSLDRAGVLDDDYDRFFDYRCGIIARRLAKKLIPQEIDRRGQPAEYNDLDYQDLETPGSVQFDFDEE